MSNGGVQIQDFLNPRSMITPGAAGGIVMMIGNTLWFQFGLDPKWSGLGISLLFGLLVLTGPAMPIWQRGVYYILNSLIVFTMAVGASNFGAAAATTTAALQPSPEWRAERTLAEIPRHDFALFRAAHAQSLDEIDQLCTSAATEDERVEALCEYIRERASLAENGDAAEETKFRGGGTTTKDKKDKDEKRSFFTPWIK